MTEHEHDHEEIARRLRDTGVVSAPAQLRDDVMAQVRAEPRARRRRRPILRPLLPYAAAACLVAGIVLALSHAGGGSSGPNAGGGASAAGGGASRAEALGPGADGAATDHRSGSAPKHPYAQRHLDHVFSVPWSATRSLPALLPLRAAGRGALGETRATARSGRIILEVPRPLYAAYLKRLHLIENRGHGPRAVTVLIKPTPLPR